MAIRRQDSSPNRESPPISDMAKPPLPTAAIWSSSSKRFRERARASGYRNADALWEDALSHVQEGWLSRPAEFPPDGDIDFSTGGANNAAFRFGVSQGEKLRALDDLRRNMTNLCTTALTPITLPTWEHRAQIAKKTHHTNIDWAFRKGDRKAAYKQLPLGPRYANLTAITLRDPKTGRWTGFSPNVLLFGAVSAAIHYNCLSRALAVPTNRIFGIPFLSYFDDVGPFCHATISPRALAVFTKSTEIIKPDVKTTKSRRDRSIEFLGLAGDLPHVETRNLLTIYLPQKKITNRSSIIDEVILIGRIRRKPLGNLIGELAYAKTSLFGGFGRTRLNPLYTKLRAHPYAEAISPEEAVAFERRAASIRASVQRAVGLRPTSLGVIIYTDAATSARILAAIVIDPDLFSTTNEFPAVLSEISGPGRCAIFCEATLIYGLELLAVVAAIFSLMDFLRGKNVAIYVDNSNTKDALVRSYSPTKVINIIVQIFWACAQ